MAYRDSANSQGASNTAASCSAPAGTVAGDRLVAVFTYDNSGAITITATGWTQLDQRLITTLDGQLITLFERVATGSDTLSLTYSGTSGSANWTIQMVALSGRHASTASTFVWTAGPDLPTTPATLAFTGLTATANADLVLFDALDTNFNSTTFTFSVPASWDAVRQTSATSTWAPLSAATRDNVSAGATGTISQTVNRTVGSDGYSMNGFVVNVPVTAVPPPTVTPAPYLGWFDGELRPDAWFDAELQPAAWWDTEIVTTSSGGGLDANASGSIASVSAIAAIAQANGSAQATSSPAQITESAPSASAVGQIVVNGVASGSLQEIAITASLAAASGGALSNCAIGQVGISPATGSASGQTTVNGSASAGIAAISLSQVQGQLSGAATIAVSASLVALVAPSASANGGATKAASLQPVQLSSVSVVASGSSTVSSQLDAIQVDSPTSTASGGAGCSVLLQGISFAAPSASAASGQAQVDANAFAVFADLLINPATGAAYGSASAQVQPVQAYCHAPLAFASGGDSAASGQSVEIEAVDYSAIVPVEGYSAVVNAIPSVALIQVGSYLANIKVENYSAKL